MTSFIKPKLKPIFSNFTKLWMVLILVIFLLLFVVNLAIILQTYSLNKGSNLRESEYQAISNKINDTDSKNTILTEQKDIALDIYASNMILKKSLKNLFDLVPDDITLDEILMGKNYLTLKGVTPSKNSYEILLESPLKSIFTDTHTTFYQVGNGWLNFVSVNKIETNEGFNE